jgi:hypothetical protein
MAKCGLAPPLLIAYAEGREQGTRRGPRTLPKSGRAPNSSAVFSTPRTKAYPHPSEHESLAGA